jgi:hypothetical protein
MGAFLLDNELVTLDSANSENVVSNEYNSSAEHISVTEIYSQFFNSGVENLQVSLLSTLFMISGLILFIYGLFGGHTYQYVMAFFFLAPGFILDDVKEQYLFRK